jgi:hypothetical protein
MYCFKTDDGEIVEQFFSMSDVPTQVFTTDGRKAVRDFQAENSPRGARGNCWPMEPCFASGVNAAQAPELRKFLADRGCATEVTSEGDPIYRSAGHRKKALKLRGMYDKASY